MFDKLKTWRDWIIGIIILITLFFIVQYNIGWKKLLTPWHELSFKLIFFLFFLTALSYLFRAIRLLEYFNSQKNIYFILLLKLTMLHNTANNLLPMRSGELVFPWLMQSYFKINFIESISALLWIRLLDIHCLTLIALLILPLYFTIGWWCAVIIWLISLIGIFLIKNLTKIVYLNQSSRWRKLLHRLCSSAPQNSKQIIKLYGWTIILWGLKFAAFTSLLHFFLPIETWRLFIGVLGGEISSVLPLHGVAGSGSYEFAIVAALIPFGVDSKLALAGAINLHLFLLGSTLILGGFGLLLPNNCTSTNQKNIQDVDHATA